MFDEPDVTEEAQQFYAKTRDLTIFFLLFIFFYVTSYIAICKFRKRPDSEDMYAGAEDAVVYRIVLWMCTFTLAVCLDGILLLPISIFCNEVIILYPSRTQWLNASLIQVLWNQVFLYSNVALFLLMPFSYLITESEGFSWSKKRISSRVIEAVIVLGLLAVIVLGLFVVVSALLQDDHTRKQTLQGSVLSDPLGFVSAYIWDIYLPYLYSCISFIGVIVLLLCTPVGFTTMFSVLGELIVKPQFLRNIEQELEVVRLEEATLLQKLHYSEKYSLPASIANGHSQTSLTENLVEIQARREELEGRAQVSSFRRNFCYPVVMLVLMAFTVLCILNVTQNTLLLMVGIKALPTGATEFSLGLTSLSAFGMVGACLEVILILYVMLASVVGFYCLPVKAIRNLRPQVGDTSMLKIILNCSILLILSSALPILSKSLGITNFNLIGNFGSMEWLGNFYIICAINIAFASTTAFCLTTKVTVTVFNESRNRLGGVFTQISNKCLRFRKKPAPKEE